MGTPRKWNHILLVKIRKLKKTFSDKISLNPSLHTGFYLINTINRLPFWMGTGAGESVDATVLLPSKLHIVLQLLQTKNPNKRTLFWTSCSMVSMHQHIRETGVAQNTNHISRFASACYHIPVSNWGSSVLIDSPDKTENPQTFTTDIT